MANTQDKPATRSPIKLEPLHDPGQSLRERLLDVAMRRVFIWTTLAMWLVIWAALEWYYDLTGARRSPLFISFFAAVALVFALVQRRRAKPEIRQLQLGIQGERSVGQFLDALRRDGYQVIHDVPHDGCNTDHVLIGPTGVFAVETKTISKPAGRDAQIVYDGRTILVDGHTPDRDPIQQAEASARRISEIIEQRTGQKVAVRPVVLYPGWFIHQRCRSPEVWVVSEGYLQAWLDHEPKNLADADIHRYAAVLGDYVRGRES